MAVTTYSATTIGMDSHIIEVEVDITPGISHFIIVGLGDASVQEAKQRVRFALQNSGFHVPRRRKVVNLAPAHLRKHGSGFDLAIAMALLAASHQIDAELLQKIVCIGELSLDGKLRPVHGILSMVHAARENGYTSVVVPEENAAEALLLQDIGVHACNSLRDAVTKIRKKNIPHFGISKQKEKSQVKQFFKGIRGQAHAKRALIIAAAGRHNCLLIGPPGGGKTILAKEVPHMLPALSPQDALEVTKIYSIAGKVNNKEPLIKLPPLQHAHHTVSLSSLIGGGAIPLPGSISFAHKGVLLLDEIAEFAPSVLNALREPLEEGTITITRAKRTVQFPCECMLLATMNPCPCGYHEDELRACTCTPSGIKRYQQKISGPLRDRIDICIPVPRLRKKDFTAQHQINTYEKQLACAFEQQQRRKQRKPNAKLQENIKKYCPLSSHAHELLVQSVEQCALSGRAYYKTIKVARTIADLEAEKVIKAHHIAEALQYRSLL